MNMRLSTYIVRVRQRNSQRTITNSLSSQTLFLPQLFSMEKSLCFYVKNSTYLLRTFSQGHTYLTYLPTL
jgi:hypothetical protein